ncbi:alkaline phosphatase family protein [Neoasaia chiangmaiensis]|nr:ectonucleotide pyrophosphatase/phosphodiesterase [Neoasaia chiangmaiensis]
MAIDLDGASCQFRQMRRFASLLLLCGMFAGCATPSDVTENTGFSGPAPVILISIDGFRPDYLHHGDTPTLDSLAEAGVSSGMHPSFPSVTFPNHYTLVTGLRPDHHGIVSNTMLDPAIPAERFSVSHNSNLDDPRWWDGAEPAWVTAETHGVHTASQFWPGSDVPIHGIRPTDWVHYDPHVTAEQETSHVLALFDRKPDQRPALTTLYFSAVDHAGHEAGPDAALTHEAVREVDTAIGHLVAGLHARNVSADILIVSDHGMARTSDQRIVMLHDLAPPADMRIITSGAYAGIDAAPGRERSLGAALARPHQHVQCWPKDQIPSHFAYGRNARVPAFLCVADVGWTLVSDHVPHNINGGSHGYDNNAADMTAVFIAQGPAFLSGHHLATFDNVDVYPLVMHLLGLMPLPSDGSILPFAPVLRGPYANLQ